MSEDPFVQMTVVPALMVNMSGVKRDAVIPTMIAGSDACCVGAGLP